MTTELRTSQVETLRALKAGGTWGLTIDIVARTFGITRQAAQRRLDRLRANPARPYVDIVLARRVGGEQFKLYRLTQLGHEALEGEG